MVSPGAEILLTEEVRAERLFPSSVFTHVVQIDHAVVNSKSYQGKCEHPASGHADLTFVVPTRQTIADDGLTFTRMQDGKCVVAHVAI